MSKVILTDNLFDEINKLVSRIERLERSVATYSRPEWRRLPLESGWTAFGGSFWDEPAYAIDSNGFAHIRGLVKSTSPFNHGTGVNTTISILPEGTRPAAPVLFDTIMYDSNSTIIFLRCDIQPDGLITVRYADYVSRTGLNSGFAQYLSLFNAPPFEVGN